MKEEEKSIAEIKAKTTDLCIHCKSELKTMKMGGSDIFGFLANSGSGAFYCENKECKFFGILTVARIAKTEKVVELK